MSRRTSRGRRWLEIGLLLSGLIAVGIWGWSHVRMAVFQSWGNRVLDSRIDNDRSAVPSPRAAGPQSKSPLPPRNGALIGRLSIPRLNVRSVVREGAGKDTLEVALGHIPGTALPGQAGNTGIAGHRDTLFRGLRNVRRDDVIDFQTPNADYKYQVESTYIVKPSDVGVLKPAQYSEMTLVTCYPFYYVGSAPDRFIVKARLLDPPAVAVTPTVQRSVPAVKSAVRPVVRAAAKPAATKVRFQVSENESRQIVPGVWLGLSGADPVQHRASIWLYTTPERRTISLRNQPADEAVLFHGTSDTQQRELMITRVTANAVTGYLLVFP